MDSIHKITGVISKFILVTIFYLVCSVQFIIMFLKGFMRNNKKVLEVTKP